MMRRRSPATGGRSRVPWKLAMKCSCISPQEEINPVGKFRSHKHVVFESHGKLVCHDFLVAVGCLDAQLVELQELRGVGGAIVARRQIRLELTRPGDTAQLGGEGAAACGGHRSPLVTRGLLLGIPTRRRQGQCGVLTCWGRDAVMTCWSREHASTFLGTRDFLTASFFSRGHPGRRVAPGCRAPWR